MRCSSTRTATRSSSSSTGGCARTSTTNRPRPRAERLTHTGPGQRLYLLLLVGGARCRQGHFVVELGEIRRHAEIFPKLGAGNQGGPGCRGHPWFGVRLGIDNRDLRLDRAVVQARHRSTTFISSLCVQPPSGWESPSHGLSSKPLDSTTNVSPSQWPTLHPIQRGSGGFSGSFLPSVQIVRHVWVISKNWSTRSGSITNSNP